MNRADGKSGFTLAELVVATTVTVLVCGSAGAILHSVAAVRSRARRQSSLQQEAKLAVGSIATVLRNAYRSGGDQAPLEGLDEQTLDYLVWLTPFGSQHPEGGVNALQQGIGRTQRFLPGKPAPGVLIYDDIHIREFHRMCQKLRYQLRRWPSEKGGPYNYTDLRIRAEVAHGS